MIIVGSQELPDKTDVMKMAKNKLSCKTRLKDKNGKRYEVIHFYPFHVLVEDDIGLKKCFTYQEVMWELIAV